MLKLTAEMTKGLKKAEITALEIAIKELPAIVTATANNSFVHTATSVNGPLLKAGLVQVATAADFDGAVDANGNAATRATDAGIAFANAAGSADAGAAGAAEEVKREKISFTTEAIPMPEVTSNRGGGVGRESIYPFKEMPVNASFFVPATEKMPKPWESLQSALANAEKKFAVAKTVPMLNADGSQQVDGEGKPVLKTVMKTVKSREKGKEGQEKQVPELVKTRTFKIFEVTEEGVKGARIWRTA